MVSAAPRLRVRAVDLFEQPYRLRLPFRFGVITVTHGLQALVRVRIEREGGGESWGYAAEALAAKWFDKNPALSDAQNIDQLRRSTEIARDAYLAAPWSSAFDLYADHYRGQIDACAAQALPPLVAGFGPALLDRAVLDALCRLEGVGFAAALRANLPGLRAHEVIADLDGFAWEPFLSALHPAGAVDVRHTVGLLDPIVASDQAPGTRVGDGLPETLEEVVAFYGNRCFKLKVSGQMDADLDRLRRIASVLDRIQEPVRITLDGNEQYDNADAVIALWRRLQADPALRRLCDSTLFIEQPIRRQAALAASVSALAACKPVIIDESDGELDTFPRARALGYGGVSSKTCKGLYKSFVNRARCTLWNQQPGAAFFMSAEDLTTQPGLSVQQDLALIDLLGITHVERNAHHFIDGFAERPQAEAQAYLQAHPDLYHLQNGRVRLRIEHGRLAMGSLQASGYASSVLPMLDDTPAMPSADWPPSPA